MRYAGSILGIGNLVLIDLVAAQPDGMQWMLVGMAVWVLAAAAHLERSSWYGHHLGQRRRSYDHGKVQRGGNIEIGQARMEFWAGGAVRV